MAAVFVLAAFLFFIRSERDASASKIIAPLFYAMALLSHESAVLFPLLAVAYLMLLASTEDRSTPPASWRKRLTDAAIATAPFFIELVIYLGIRLWVLGFINRTNITNSMTRTQELLTMPSVLGTYAMLLIAPWRAAPVHPVDVVSSVFSVDFYLPMLALIGLATAALLGLWSDRRRMLYLFCAIWIAVTLAPVMNLRAFTPIALIEDRYLYMASAAWSIALAELMVSFSFRHEPTGRLLAAATITIILVCAAILFHVQSYWHDEYALFSTCVEISPRSSLCQDRLGVALIDRGDMEGAERHFTIAHEIAPGNGASLYHLGGVHVRLGRSEQGLGELKRALAILTDAPAGAWIEYAKLADSLGKTDERDAALRHAETLPGGVKSAENARAQLMITHGDLAGAESLLRAGIARDPSNANQWTLLGVSLARQGRNEEALEAYRESLRLRPDPSLERMISQMAPR